MADDAQMPSEPKPTPAPTKSSNRTALGLGENVEALLAYLFGIISGIIFILIEKDNKFIRFHAMQSIITSLVFIVIGWIPVIGWLFVMFIAPIVWLILIIAALMGKMFKLPIIGDIAEKQANK